MTATGWAAAFVDFRRKAGEPLRVGGGIILRRFTLGQRGWREVLSIQFLTLEPDAFDEGDVVLGADGFDGHRWAAALQVDQITGLNFLSHGCFL